MCREVERVDLRLRQVVPPRYVALRLVLREPRQGIDQILLPRPRHHSTQMRTNLVRGATWISSFLCCSVRIDPIQKLTEFFSSKLVKWKSTAPAFPLSESRGILLASSLCWITAPEKIVKVICASINRNAGPVAWDDLGDDAAQRLAALVNARVSGVKQANGRDKPKGSRSPRIGRSRTAARAA